ncbi:aminopeptidase [Vagococcus penaei]|uniref:Aminopeptidase n=1 Tax=Vagococcus penaei TaxID=633807 RepID=A0A1Q2D4D4_9ENTE|nr:aminopeptidase [Vagococcus penaei]AQP53117.1 aminopeptidase [Vagococcus penaei]RSU06021.1 aminopeptidase [Vagococcus penaei]
MTINQFDSLLRSYAQVITKVGVNVQKSHTVVVTGQVEQAPLVRLIVEEAYKLGAKQVITQWQDDIVNRQNFLYADEEILTTVPDYKISEMHDWLDKDASRISIVSSNPDAFSGVDSHRLAEFQKASGKAMMPLRQATQANKISWLVVAAAGKDWAAKVFPELDSNDEQVDALWTAIFEATRMFEEDPISAWYAHEKLLQSKAEELNAEQFDALHYTAPGTDLVIGLPEGHIWEGAGSKNARGETFIANMPTEEVFTAPDRLRIDGVVSSTKPLSYSGTTIEGMVFTFKNGKVIEVTAEKGEDVLKKLLDTDEGAKSLGEVALVPDSSPISQSGIVFYNTLFDENASNHLALGSAYAFNLKGGTEMTDDELEEAGLNRSQTHVDFMIGSDKMSIDGIKKDGSRVPIFRNGEWA